MRWTSLLGPGQGRRIGGAGVALLLAAAALVWWKAAAGDDAAGGVDGGREAGAPTAGAPESAPHHAGAHGDVGDVGQGGTGSTGSSGGTHGSHGSHGDDPGPEVPLSGADRVLFDQQWAQAVAAATDLATVEQAEAAGYAQAGPHVPGVGAHWINWAQIDAPFDPARPSMLLFDLAGRRPSRLAGFSYWVLGATEPAGFAGPNDHWHQHAGLCFADGWLQREDVPDPSGCRGEWLVGTDRWMLHAWVVAEVPNPAGNFAGRNRALCPPDRGPGGDYARCTPPPGSTPPSGIAGFVDGKEAPAVGEGLEPRLPDGGVDGGGIGYRVGCVVPAGTEDAFFVGEVPAGVGEERVDLPGQGTGGGVGVAEESSPGLASGSSGSASGGEQEPTARHHDPV